MLSKLFNLFKPKAPTTAEAAPYKVEAPAVKDQITDAVTQAPSPQADLLKAAVTDKVVQPRAKKTPAKPRTPRPKKS
jgi:hypothetical protein